MGRTDGGMPCVNANPTNLLKLFAAQLVLHIPVGLRRVGLHGMRQGFGRLRVASAVVYGEAASKRLVHLLVCSQLRGDLLARLMWCRTSSGSRMGLLSVCCRSALSQMLPCAG